MQTSPGSLGRPGGALRVVCQQTGAEKYMLRQSCKRNKTEGQSWRHTVGRSISGNFCQAVSGDLAVGLPNPQMV